MAETLVSKKAQRLNLIYNMLMATPKGLTTQELAHRCGVTQRTIQRDLLDLQDEPFRVPLIEEDHRWKVLPHSKYILPPVRFELTEAAALFLAARMLSRYADERMPCIESALCKLTAILPSPIAEHIRGIVRALENQPADEAFSQVFATIVMGWALRRKVRIWHQSGSSDNMHEYLLCPYFIEPSGIGYAIYVIGYASFFDDVHTFKLERIRRAELTEEAFEMPAGFDVLALLSTAWGVMYGDKTQTVALRFSPMVARRVRETVWHPTQEIVEEPDGGCRLTVRVAHPLEMQPWIRGWGAECEVLAPAWLREAIAEDMRRAAEVYGNRVTPELE